MTRQEQAGVSAEVRELLEEIAAGKGPYKQDNYDFACSVIETAKENAKKVLALLATAPPEQAASRVMERIVSREEFNDSIADEAAQSCVDWSDPEHRKEALRYTVKQIWNEATDAALEKPNE